MAARRWAPAVAAALYAALLAVPWGWLAAPLASGVLVGALAGPGLAALGGGALAGLAGFLAYAAASGGLEALWLLFQLAGPAIGAFGVAYHPLAAGLAAWLSAPHAPRLLARLGAWRGGGGGGGAQAGAGQA